MAGSKFSRLGMSSPMSIPHSSSSADDDVTEEDAAIKEEPTEDDADKVDVDAAITVADDVVVILADDADVTTASDVIAAVVSVITLLAVPARDIVVAVIASFSESDSPSNFASFSSSSSCPSLIWASFRWKKEPLDGEERGTDTTRR